MSAGGTLDLLARREGARLFLCSPGVGWPTAAVPEGRALVAGEAAGCLITLGVERVLVVPAGAAGRVVNAAPERVHEPVGHGSVLYELAPLAEDAARAESTNQTTMTSSGALVFRSPSAGRYWQRPSPKEPPHVQAGGEISEGQPIGLIEVMKTFTRISYRAEHGLPPRARVLRVLVSDGADVREGEALLELTAS